MGQKDLTEKILMDHNDVFADIINGLVFEGKQVIKPNDLCEAGVHSQFKADDSVYHELERDVAKQWVEGGVNILICGLENQTKIEEFMPARIIGYDGASYKSQLLKHPKKLIPVMSIVLYFGDTHWNKPTNLKGLMNVPDGLDDFVNDHKMHVYEIAFLSDEEIDRFQSDFKLVAKFFQQKRINPNYRIGGPEVIDHVDEILKMLSVFTGSNIYIEVKNDLTDSDRKGDITMDVVAERMTKVSRHEGIAEGKKQGIAEGKKQGLKEGSDMAFKLLNCLVDDERNDDIKRIAHDEKYRLELMKEYGILN